MTINKFREDALLVAKRLRITEENIGKTVEMLQRLLNTDKIVVSQWQVREGQIFLTFNSDTLITAIGEEGGYIQHALKAMFPHCRMCGTLVEIESGELL